MSHPTETAPPSRAVLTDCWNKIGVQGDGSCPELLKYIHCRNCPVFSAAATALFERALPPGYLDEWTTHFAREKPVHEDKTLAVFLFRLGPEWFALPVAVLQEIMEVKTIHSLPHRRHALVLGLVNFRGELLVCVSLAEALGLSKTEMKSDLSAAAHPYHLIVSQRGQRLVFPVDAVAGIQHFHPREVKKVPATVAGNRLTYTKGILAWEDKSVGWLDDELLLGNLGRSLS